MNTKDEIDVTLEEEPEALERRADEVRDRLMNTLEAIDRRRHDLTNPKALLMSHRREAVIAAGALTTLVAGVTAVAIWRARHRDERLRKRRVRAARRSWQHPERLAAERPRGFVRELGRRVLLGALTFVAMQLVKRTVQRGLADDTRAQLEMPKVPRATRKSFRPPEVSAFVKAG